MEEYSAIKKNEIMPFLATWMDLEIVTLSEARQRQIPQYIAHRYNQIFKNDTDGLIYKTGTDSHSLKTDLWLPKGKIWGEGNIRSLR